MTQSASMAWSDQMNQLDLMTQRQHDSTASIGPTKSIDPTGMRWLYDPTMIQ